MRVPRRDAGGGRQTTLSFGVALRMQVLGMEVPGSNSGTGLFQH